MKNKEKPKTASTKKGKHEKEVAPPLLSLLYTCDPFTFLALRNSFSVYLFRERENERTHCCDRKKENLCNFDVKFFSEKKRVEVGFLLVRSRGRNSKKLDSLNRGGNRANKRKRRKALSLFPACQVPPFFRAKGAA